MALLCVPLIAGTCRAMKSDMAAAAAGGAEAVELRLDDLEEWNPSDVGDLLRAAASFPGQVIATYRTAAEGGQNGLVWLVRPDAEKRITVSVGRGLPRLAAEDCVEIAEAAKRLILTGDYDGGVKALVSGTDKRLRAEYGTRKGK